MLGLIWQQFHVFIGLMVDFCSFRIFFFVQQQRWARFRKKVSTKAIPIIFYLKSVSIVSLQIPEVLSDEAIQVLFCKKFESAKRMYRFKPQNFQRWSDTSTFMPKIMNLQSDYIVSNPRIFNGEAIQVLLLQKIWISKAIASFQTTEFFKVKLYKYF